MAAKGMCITCGAEIAGADVNDPYLCGPCARKIDTLINRYGYLDA